MGGTHRWYLKGVTRGQLYDKLDEICKSHWPDNPDCVPVTVQCGAADDKVVVRGNIPISKLSSELPMFDQYMIIAQYQLLHISDPWPMTGKPSHITGTVLSLQVRGGAEILQIDPTALTTGGIKGIAGCVESVEHAATQGFNSRIRIPLTEYHITYDRLTDTQLCRVMSGSRKWKLREGTVNYERFMNEPPGTLLFDSWTLEQTFAPDIRNPRRWRLGCILKCRQVPESKGTYPEDCRVAQYAVGWNHDYKRRFLVTDDGTPDVTQDPNGDLGWWFIMMRDEQASVYARLTPHGLCPIGLAPRYPYTTFSDIFCRDTLDVCDQAEHPAGLCNEGGASSSSQSLRGGGDFTAQRLAEIQEDSRGVVERSLSREEKLRQLGITPEDFYRRPEDLQ